MHHCEKNSLEMFLQRYFLVCASLNSLKKGRRKRGNIDAETFRVNVPRNVAWVNKPETRKNSLLPRSKFCVFRICCLGTQTREQTGNIQSQCFFSVPQMIPRLHPHVTYVEDTKSAS